MVPPLFVGSEKRAYYCFLGLSVIKMMAWEERGYYTEMFKIRFNHGCMLVIGGAKSGKSRFALNVCNSMNRKRIFLATAQALDREMEERIRRHREGRGEGWHTVEEPTHIADKIRDLDNEDTIILIDCLTLWLNNLFMKYGEFRQPVNELCDEFVEQLTKAKGVIIVVSNEVGMGIVPDNDLARVYRDVAGSLNQRIAGTARKVVAVMAGIPVLLKDE